MGSKRDTLKTIAGLSAVTAALPNTWTKPLIEGIVLPVHAQTSATQAPAVSDISCSMDTDELRVGTVITLTATISDQDTAIENIEWAIKKNDTILETGTGQFTTTNYTVLAEDVGSLKLELEVFDDTDNSITALFCEDGVIAQAPTISDISCSFDTATLEVDSVITLEATINDLDTPIEDLTWTLSKNGSVIDTGIGQFAPYNYTVLVDDIGMLSFELEISDGTGNSASGVLCEEEVLLVEEEFYGENLVKTNVMGGDSPIPFCSVKVVGSSVNVRYVSGANNRILGGSFNIGDGTVSLDVLEECPDLNPPRAQTLTLVEYIPGVSFSFRRVGSRPNGSEVSWEITVPLATILDFSLQC